MKQVKNQSGFNLMKLIQLKECFWIMELIMSKKVILLSKINAQPDKQSET